MASMSATSSRVLPAPWALTARDLERLCGRPVDPDPHVVLVADVEGLCRGAMADAQRRGSLARDIETGDWLELLGFLLGEVVVRARKFDPTRQGIQFRPWLYEQLRGFAVVDATRWLYGRDGRHRLSPGEGGAAAVDDGAGCARRSRGAPTDPADDWIAGLAGIDAGGDGEADGDLGGGCVEARRGAAGRDRRAGAVTGGGVAGGGAGAASYFRDCVACGWRNYAQAPNGVDRWHFASCSACGAALEPAEVAA